MIKAKGIFVKEHDWIVVTNKVFCSVPDTDMAKGHVLESYILVRSFPKLSRGFIAVRRDFKIAYWSDVRTGQLIPFDPAVIRPAIVFSSK